MEEKEQVVFVVVVEESIEEKRYAAERRRRWKEYQVEKAEDYGSEWYGQDGESDFDEELARAKQF